MKNIAIVCDSSASLTSEQIKETGVFVAPLTIVHSGKEFVDQITITNDDVLSLIKEGVMITTSQPNVGSLIELFEELKAKNYDHIFMLPLTRHLSGTYSVFTQAALEVELENYTIIDTETLAGPIQKGIYVINEMNEKGASIEDIEKALYRIYNDTESYLVPLTLKQLKAGGRISPTAAALASLLKIKPVLKLWNKGITIEKFDTARTEAKTVDIMINDLIKENITPETHDIYILEADGMKQLNAMRNALEERMGNFKINVSTLPAALVTHAGPGSIAVQYVPK